MPAGKRVRQAEGRGHEREEERNVGQAVDHQAALERSGGSLVIPSEKVDHAGSRMSHHETEGVILGLRYRRGVLCMRDGLVEAPLLGQDERQPHARHDRG